MLALDAAEEMIVRNSLSDALAVLYPGSMQHRQQLIMAEPPVAAEQPALDALAKVWDGVVTTAATFDHGHGNLGAFVVGTYGPLRGGRRQFHDGHGRGV